MEFLKERLLGAVFILGLMVTFVPAIFDGQGMTSSNEISESYQVALTQQLAGTMPSAQAPVIKSVQHTNVSAWTVRIGAFSDHTAALQLEQKLQDQGYIAYSQMLPDSDLYGVFVGPEQIAQNAEIVLEQLHKQLDLNGVVVPYEPVLYVQNS